MKKTNPTYQSLPRKVAVFIVLLVALLTAVAGCTAAPSSTMMVSTPAETGEGSRATEQANTLAVEASPTSCILSPIVAPTMPAVIPGYTEVDPATGLHMTGEVQEIDLTSYRLEVTGRVDHPLKLSYDDLRCMPKVEKHLVLTCPGFFQDTATWAGVPLDYVLKLAGVQSGAIHIKLYSADGYYITMPLENARAVEGFLAYELEGETLPRLHGFPLRAVFPGMAGSNWVKWLVAIEVY
jgi:DMSO/TMAO reductase YedYZ molybdopterin-dependent catalytic subunit